MKTPLLLLCSLLLLQFSNAAAQKTNNIYISPAVHVGYAFNGGWSLGFDIDMGFWQKISSDGDIVNSGFSLGKYWYQTYHGSFDRITTINYMRETENTDIKSGFAFILDPHGYNNRINCWRTGVNIDLSATGREIYIPYIGLKTVLYDWSNWYGFNGPYMSLYTKYKYDILQKSGIKTINPITE